MTRLRGRARSPRRSATGDARLGNNALKDDDAFTARAGQRVVVILESDAFDSYLVLQGPGGFRVIADDTDGADTDNARLEATLPAAGTCTLSASSYASGETGSCKLTVSGITGLAAAAGAGARPAR